MKRLRSRLPLWFGLVLGLLLATVAVASTTVTYTGQGFTYDGTTYTLNDQRCGLSGQNDADDGGTGLFANWNGPGQPYTVGDGYLVWVLSANGASSAKLYLPSGVVSMIKVGGTFKYASRDFARSTLVSLPVRATYEGTAKGSVQLVVSHGCQPFNTDGAWCSPGYWRNAQPAAWALIGVDRAGALFNSTVVPNFYAYASPAEPTLLQVLTTPGANTFGAAAPPYNINAFNATAAYLTSRIPGFHFDRTLIGNEDACPIDHHGNYKFP